MQKKILHTQKFLRKIQILLFVTLLIMIGGFFTWSENIVITRIIKVGTRVGMTISIYWIYQQILAFGALSSFKWKNAAAPFLYAGYLLLGLASIMWSTDAGYSALQWVMDLESLVFAYFFIKCLSVLEAFFPNNNIRLTYLLGNTSLLILIIFLIGSVFATEQFIRLTDGGTEERLGGNIMNPNELGMLCGISISCFVFELLNQKNKWANLLKLLIPFIALILTRSRSSLIGVLLIIIFHIYQSSNRKLKIAVYLTILAVIPVAMQQIIIKSGGMEDVLSMTGRLPFWKALINEGLPREPLLGFGFMRIDYHETFESVHTYAGHMTHNTFIQVLMNLGFIGLTLVLFQVFFTLKGFIKEQKQKKLMLFGILIPVLINSFTEFGIFGETNYGILFYQLLFFSISLQYNPLLTKAEQLLLLKKRPELFSSTTPVPFHRH